MTARDGPGPEPSPTDVVFGVGTPPVIYAATDRGVYVSRDGGLAWTCLTGQFGPMRFEKVVVDCTDPSVLYAVPDPFPGLLRSSDGGVTWVYARNIGYVTE
jgi:hypothetical protein